MSHSIELGSGLIGIGRKWGYVQTPIPTENKVEEFLQTAVDLGIKYFDTAPAYGKSEKRLGRFLLELPPEKRNLLIIGTKFGEFWNNETQTTYIDHSYDALTRSTDQSLKLLGHIDIMQVHKTTSEVLKSKDLSKAIDYCRRKGILQFGASVSDIESAKIVCEDSTYEFIQFPYNTDYQEFGTIFELAMSKNKKIIVNRPFNMGASIENGISPIEAYKFILEKGFSGYILTGTKSASHLRSNKEHFDEAKSEVLHLKS